MICLGEYTAWEIKLLCEGWHSHSVQTLSSDGIVSCTMLLVDFNESDVD